MKKLTMITAVAAIVAVGCGCTSSQFEKSIVRSDGTREEISAKIWSHMLKREMDSVKVTRNGDGVFDFELNGYKSDTSEQLPNTVMQAFNGLALIGRIAGAAFNPAVGAVPLTQEGASAADVEKITKATAELKAAEAAAKVALAKAKATQAQAKAAEAEAKAAEAQANASQATEDVECDGDECVYE